MELSLLGLFYRLGYEDLSQLGSMFIACINFLIRVSIKISRKENIPLLVLIVLPMYFGF